MRDKPGAVLVTGGAGFVGSHVVRLCSATRPVHVLDNLSTSDVAHMPPEATFQFGDVRSEEDILRALSEGVEAIVHCAAQTSVARSMATRSRLVDQRRRNPQCCEACTTDGYQAFRILLLWRRSLRRNRVAGVRFRDAATGQLLRAQQIRWGADGEVGSAVIGDPPALEHLWFRTEDRPGGRRRIDLPGTPAAGATVDIYGDGLQRRDFVYVNDVVDAVELALKGTENVTWNVSSGRSTSVLNLLETLRAVTGLDASIRCQPARAGDIRTSHLSPVA